MEIKNPDEYFYYINREDRASSNIRNAFYHRVIKYGINIFEFRIHSGRSLGLNDPYVRMSIKYPANFPYVPPTFGFFEFYKNTNEEIENFVINVGIIYAKLKEEWNKEMSIPKILISLRNAYCDMFIDDKALSVDRKLIIPHTIYGDSLRDLEIANGLGVDSQIENIAHKRNDLMNRAQGNNIIRKEPQKEEQINLNTICFDSVCFKCHQNRSINESIVLGYLIRYEDNAMFIESELCCHSDYLKNKDKNVFWIPIFYSKKHLYEGLTLINKQKVYSLFNIVGNSNTFNELFWIKLFPLILEENIKQILEIFKKEKKISEKVTKSFFQLYIAYCNFIKIHCNDLTKSYEQIDIITQDYLNNNHYIRALILLSAIDKKYLDNIKYIQLVVINLLRQVCLSEDFRILLLKLTEKTIITPKKEKDKTPIPKDPTPGLVPLEDLDKEFYERFEYWNEFFEIMKNNYIIKPKKVAADGSRRNIRPQEVPFVEKIRRVITGVEEKTIIYSEVEKDNILDLINSHYVKTEQGIVKHEVLDELKRYNEIIENDERNKKRLEMPLSELLDNSVLYYEEIIKYVLESNIEDKTYLYFQFFYANSFENENFINSAINNHGFITEEQIGLLESVFYYIDSIKTIQEGLDILSNNKQFQPEEIIYYIQKSITL